MWARALGNDEVDGLAGIHQACPPTALHSTDYKSTVYCSTYFMGNANVATQRHLISKKVMISVLANGH